MKCLYTFLTYQFCITNPPWTVNLKSSVIFASQLLRPMINFGGWFVENSCSLSSSLSWLWMSSTVSSAELLASPMQFFAMQEYEPKDSTLLITWHSWQKSQYQTFSITPFHLWCLSHSTDNIVARTLEYISAVLCLHLWRCLHWVITLEHTVMQPDKFLTLRLSLLGYIGKLDIWHVNWKIYTYSPGEKCHYAVHKILTMDHIQS